MYLLLTRWRLLQQQRKCVMKSYKQRKSSSISQTERYEAFVFASDVMARTFLTTELPRNDFVIHDVTAVAAVLSMGMPVAIGHGAWQTCVEIGAANIQVETARLRNLLRKAQVALGSIKKSNLAIFTFTGGVVTGDGVGVKTLDIAAFLTAPGKDQVMVIADPTEFFR
jgi:hypothetical protein